MFGWLKKMHDINKTVSDKKIFEDVSLCKAKVDKNILVMKDTECSPISELKQNQKFLEALNAELRTLKKECMECKNIINLVEVLKRVDYELVVRGIEAEYMRNLISKHIDIHELIKELESIESSNKIIHEYQNNISEVNKRIYQLKKELGIEGI